MDAPHRQENQSLRSKIENYRFFCSYSPAAFRIFIPGAAFESDIEENVESVKVIIPYSIEYIMARGLNNNNPGNIVKGGKPFLGEILPSKDARFRQFTHVVYGYRAMLKLLQNYKVLHGCGTIRLIINRWAPPVENDTSKYVKYVCEQTGLSKDDAVDVFDKKIMMKLAAAISQMENGEKAVMSDIEKGWDLLCGNR